MAIGWFPGHMAAARKQVEATLARVDVVIEVIDARLPGASSNPLIESLRLHRQRPCLKVLNKADLADPGVTAAWLRWFAAQGAASRVAVEAVAVSCKKHGEAAAIPAAAARLAPHRGTSEKPVRMIVLGIPNVGKSTLVNALVKRKVAHTGDEPAITKHQSRYPLAEGMELFDTPGLMWPKIRYPSDGLMLAASHAIGRNAYIDEEVAVFLGDLLISRYPALLEARYGCPVAGLDGVALIEAIAARRGFRVRGGGVDFDKAGLVLLQDYRSGALGRISLETPDSRAAMIAAAGEPAEPVGNEADGDEI
jgi:ribosome biogenesis GTPase A